MKRYIFASNAVYMYRIIISFLLGCIFSSSFSLAQSSTNLPKKTEFVMILSSYAYEKEWSTALVKEIRNKLKTQKPELKVHITYAGMAARTSFLADRFAMQGAFANGRLNNQIKYPDVLILIGDESWMLYRIMDNRGVWRNIPVVLCGVHDEIMKDYKLFFPDKQLPDSSFIPLDSPASAMYAAAVIEPDNTARTLQLARTLVPRLQHLYFLSDGSYVDSYMRKKLHRESEKRDVAFTEILVDRSNVDSVGRVLDEIPDETVVVTNGAMVPQNARAPVLTLRDMSYQSHIPLGGYFASVSDYADKTAESVFRILQADTTAEKSYAIAPDMAFYMNQTALMHAGLRSATKNLPNVVERNIPPPFIFRHIRVISISLLVLIILAFVSFHIISSYRYSHNLNLLFERYKTLYDEYQLVYENMPVGLMLFDIYGNLLNRNVETDTFFEQYAFSRSVLFHIFDPEILDDNMRAALSRRELVSKMIYLKDFCYRLQCCIMADEETGTDHILVIVIDNTEIERERKTKEQISNVLNFAMNKAGIGVAEYNLFDGSGFATDAWYDTLGMERNCEDFLQIHQCLVRADREKVQRYLENVRYGNSHLFLDTLQIQTRTGEKHYIRYLIQPLEYAPDQQHIIVAELVVNMDRQMAKERELEAAMKKAQEADRFKNAFVANMKDGIRIPLKEIISCAQELVATTDLEHRTELNARIEIANSQMLGLLNEIIEMSKVELNE